MTLDLFPDFSFQSITTSSGAHIFVRVSEPRNKRPLLLLHGFPQTHAEYHKLTPLLLPHFTIILLDLRGYGASSSGPHSSKNGSGYTKRLMGHDCVSVMQQLGFDKFDLVGHDRGARVAYRLAFDMPERLNRVVAVDIVPTASMFRGFGNVKAALKGYHWLFLGQPEPFPERMIGSTEGGGRMFLEHSLASWTATTTLDCFDATAMQQYREAYCNEEKIHTTCEDYRAGVFFDRVYDEEELEKGRKIQVPLLAVWGKKGLFAEVMEEGKKEGPLQVWQKYCANVQGKGMDSGHFIPEEDPEALASEILQFLQ